MTGSGWRLRLYRDWVCRLAERVLLPRFFDSGRIDAGTGAGSNSLMAVARAGGFSNAGLDGISKARTDSVTLPGKSSLEGASSDSLRRIWFHAASVGELESIWTVIVAAGAQGHELSVTVFSPSAEKAVERLAAELRQAKSKLLFAGYSPWEGRWAEALAAVGPTDFVTAKYEAWPELWASLSLAGIRLTVVGARARKSLATAFRFCGWLGVLPPKIRMLATTAEDAEGLRSFLTTKLQARGTAARDVVVTGDPRWDRVYQRSQAGSPRARELMAKRQGLPRPWTVFGSTWLSDLNAWGSGLAKLPGTIWLVPHHVDNKTVSELEAFLDSHGLENHVRTSGSTVSSGADPRVLIVNEMGFLSELYSAADAAYVGGGFEAGVHSTIEPALQGLPVLTGPKNADRFPEIAELSRTGQLLLVRDSKEITAWLEKGGWTSSAGKPPGASSSTQWKDQAQSRLGATSRVLEQIISTQA